MKKIIVFSSLTLFAFSFSIYQGCKKHVSHCLLLNKVNMMTINSNTGLPMQAGDSVLAKKLRINITLDTKEILCMNSTHFSFIGSAYAHNVEQPYLYYDTLKNVSITCLQHFDSTHSAGISLNQYFNVPPVFQAADEFVKTYSFDLQVLPDSAMLYEFRVTVEMAGGALYDTILPPVKILL